MTHWIDISRSLLGGLHSIIKALDKNAKGLARLDRYLGKVVAEKGAAILYWGPFRQLHRPLSSQQSFAEGAGPFNDCRTALSPGAVHEAGP